MSPTLALLLWLVLLFALFNFDPARNVTTSPALWVPLIWLTIVGSRLPSQWLDPSAKIGAVQAVEQGNPLDALIYSLLILLALAILAFRSFNWNGFLSRNIPLIAYLCFALLSICWSDFRFITFKRWIRDSGNYLVLLVVLSDPNQLETIRTLLRRLCYLLIPLSVLLLKYYPQLAVRYNYWSGLPENVGAATSKNMLGVLCLVSGIFLFWDIAMRWSARNRSSTKRILFIDFVLFFMTMWLLQKSASSTSELCFILGCLVIALTHSRLMRSHPRFFLTSIPVGICLYLVLTFAFGIDLNALVAQLVGKDPTLTGRTVIWSAVLSVHTNPLVGAGYECFWLGARLTQVWQLTGVGINEAHNGYLEVYLNLGIVGLLLVGALLIASYRSICRRVRRDPAFGSLSLALWTILLFYNVSESAFKGHLIFLAFLLVAMTVPGRRAVSERAHVSGRWHARSSASFRHRLSL